MRTIFNMFFRKYVRRMINKELNSYDSKLAVSLDKYMTKVLAQVKGASQPQAYNLQDIAHAMSGGYPVSSEPAKPKAPIGFHSNQI